MNINPTLNIGAVQMRLTEICHGAGIARRWHTGRKDSYYDAYMEQLYKIAPDHPHIAAEGWRPPKGGQGRGRRNQ